MENTIVIVLQKMKYGKYHCKYSYFNKRCYDKILSDWNYRLPSMGFKCILVGLMNMIDGMQFWTPILFYRHKTVLVSPWLCCIDK
jgi:hypothetical protein